MEIKLIPPEIERKHPKVMSFEETMLSIPRLKYKKDYKELEKETTKWIEEIKQRIRDGEFSGYSDDVLDIYIQRKQKIKKIVDFLGVKKGELDLVKAKEYPVEQLLEFKSSGFTDCIFHTDEKQKTPSLKWYPKENIVYCFAMCGKHDTIDVYQKLYNVSFLEAVKKLC